MEQPSSSSLAPGGGRDTVSPQPSEVESLEDVFEGDEGAMEEPQDDGAPGEEANDLADSSRLNFVGATIRDASYPGDGDLGETQ